jgi:hypothetical protein
MNNPAPLRIAPTPNAESNVTVSPSKPLKAREDTVGELSVEVDPLDPPEDLIEPLRTAACSTQSLNSSVGV